MILKIWEQYLKGEECFWFIFLIIPSFLQITFLWLVNSCITYFQTLTYWRENNTLEILQTLDMSCISRNEIQCDSWGHKFNILSTLSQLYFLYHKGLTWIYEKLHFYATVMVCKYGLDIIEFPQRHLLAWEEMKRSWDMKKARRDVPSHLCNFSLEYSLDKII